MSNLERLRTYLRDHQISAFLISDVGGLAWATDFTGTFGYIVARPDGGVFITDSRYTIQAQEQVQGLEVVSFASPTDGADFLAEQVRKLGVSKLAFDSATVSYGQFKKWEAKLIGIELYGIEDPIGELRMVKTPEEIVKLQAACALADACFEHVQRMIQPGVSEWDIGLDIEFFFRRHGADIAFPPIVVSGNRSARPHGRASEKKLESGDFLTLDFGARLDDYCSDITRTVVVGQATDRHREIYDTVLKAQVACLEVMRPGMPARDVDALARKVMDEKGLAKFFGHGLGHGLGKLVHDSGRMNPSSETVLEPGQVWTVEPGIYVEGFGGVRIEDDVVVTAAGIDILTHSPKQMLVLPA